MNKLASWFSPIFLIFLIACGGGAGAPDPVEEFEINFPPTARAPADFTAVENTQVTLNGSESSDIDGSITYAWAQTGGSPTVVLTNNLSAVTSFIAPTVSANTLLTFTLTVLDNDGESNTDSVIVTVVPDQPPEAVVAADFDAIEGTQVLLDASLSSDDVGIVSYLWEQISGDQVALAGANSGAASFTAPMVDEMQTLPLGFRLTVTDALGATDTDEIVVTIIDTPDVITLSGKVTFDLVRHNTSTNGLDHPNTIESAIRGATIELLNANNSSIVATTVSDDIGDYSFEVTPITSYRVRVKAQLKQSGTPSWDFSVVDNTSAQALYAMDSAIQAMQNVPVVLNLNADSGWTGASYANPRVAAPFAILDAIYQAKNKIIAVDSDVSMAALKLNWSTNNVAVDGDVAAGEISTSHFNGTEIYILGDANGDTDEYDDHVIVHEWGHYLEGLFSRSDSIGGNHSGSDKLDLRVAVGEGFGNALSGIITDDPVYRDSFGTNQTQGFSINVETNPSSNRGWFSESSVQSLLYDIYDSQSDGADNISLGFAPIYQALINGEKETEAVTSIFSLANQIKVQSPANAAAIDLLLASQNIIAADDFASTETNNGGDPRNLPIFKSIAINGAATQICSYGTNGQYNKLGNHQFIQFDIVTGGSYQFVATGGANSDPDFYVYKKGEFVFSSDEVGNESTTQTLTTGKHIIDAYEYSNIEGTPMDSCINITISNN